MDNIILGIFHKPPRENYKLGFIKVIGEYIDGKICIGKDYFSKYPNQGEVAIYDPPASLGVNSIGLFKVDENEMVNRTLSAYSEYKVASKDWTHPIEIYNAPTCQDSFFAVLS